MANPLTLPMVPRALKNLASRPATRRYPYEIRERFDGARGTIVYDVETCNCSWTIEHLTCIGCNVCVEVCAKKSLTMSKDSKPVHTRAEVGPLGQRPGHEEWHKPVPEPGE